MRSRVFCATVSILAGTLLTACGGGDSDSPPQEPALSGTAAVGAPIVGGTVNVICAAGSAIAPTQTNASGAWQVSMTGQTLPCAVKVSGGTANGLTSSVAYHSLAVTSFTVNITPLTDLIVANLARTNPSTWFDGLTPQAVQSLSQSSLAEAISRVTTALGMTTALGGNNPVSTTFQAVNGNTLDDILEALAKAREDAGASHQSLLTFAQGPNFVAPSGFNFANAYAALSSGTGGSTDSCAAGETATTYATTAASGPYTNGQQVCFNASSSTLAFAGKTLSNPTPNTVVSAPYSAYSFADGNNVYEVVFNAGTLHEINLSVGGTFNGQFTPGTDAGTDPGTGTDGNANLTLQTTVAGTTTTIPIGNVPRPTSEEDFCNAVRNGDDLTRIATTGGGTLTINSCSYSGNVGNISATLSLTSPIVLSTPWTVVYTYN